MSLITLENISIAFGHVNLLTAAQLRLEKGERVCLIGRNGEGKSTLLKIISRELAPDQGKVEYQQGCRIARLAQEPLFEPHHTVFHAVAAGLGKIGELIEEYYTLAHHMDAEDAEALNRLAKVQQQLEASDGWLLEQKVETVLSRLELPAEQKVAELSGGWKRRVALAQILVTDPDVLLLDEPTNHLDIEAIQWLEEMLVSFNGALLFVSHDRSFMQRVATRILELDRGQLTSYPGDYDTYLVRKQEQLEAEATQAAKFDKFLAQEEVWIRQGIKARRTRNEGRVRRLKELRVERSKRREQMGNMKLKIDGAQLSGKLVIEAEHVKKGYQDKTLIEDFSTVIMRGDRIGLIGPNGVGKTTLLKMLLKTLEPDSGTVKHGTQLSIAYFDQLRDELNLEESVFDAVGQGQDFIDIGGQRKHVMSYLGDFLFAPARARSPIKTLSGGERNRLLLARLFTKPANVLVMDEPTNDLDVESLELLEEVLAEFSGTLLLVSHDRRFLDNVVTASFVFEGDGKVSEYVGGYSDWVRQRPAETAAVVKPAEKKAEKAQASTASAAPAKRKLSYKEQRELNELPQKIEQLETALAELQEHVSDPAFYKQDNDAMNATLAKLQKLEGELAVAYERWEALDQ